MTDTPSSPCSSFVRAGLVAGLVVVVGGCAHDGMNDSQVASAEPHNEVTAEPSAEGLPPADKDALWVEPIDHRRHEGLTAIVIASNILDRCSLFESEAYFAYDSAELRPADEESLESLALCMTRGPLAAFELELVAHTDPRGTESYNDDLAEDRAEAVAELLAAEGVPESRMKVISEGEALAHSNPQAWPVDRRVDVVLVEGDPIMANSN